MELKELIKEESDISLLKILKVIEWCPRDTK
jgi:hypothetical protein